ncbi:MAG: endonuclease/exonuclease/phosphatase family protein [Bacteroidota bacterium]
MNKIILVFNSVFILLLLFSCAVPYISSEAFSFLSILSLTVPFLVVLNCLFLIYWLLIGKKQFLWSLSVLILGYGIHGDFYKIKLSKSEIDGKGLQVMSFNTMSFSKVIPNLEYKITDFVSTHSPDIICFQEFDFKQKRSKNFKEYPYRFIDFEYGVTSGRVLQAIYSKYPIVHKGIFFIGDIRKNCTIGTFGEIQDTLRVYNLHLQSLKIRASSLTEEPSAKLFKRVTKSFAKQQQQVGIVTGHMRSTDHKKIVCGDFNNTQFSNVYYTLKDNMLDTFKEKGSGFGRTYSFARFPGRIDFILTDPSFEVLLHKNFDVRLSDHFPVMASIRLKDQ